jgi:hypothetical protein
MPNVGDCVEFCNTFPHVLQLYQITRLTKYVNFVGNKYILFKHILHVLADRGDDLEDRNM